MRLRIEKGAASGQVFDLEPALVTIGRAADNDIVLADEMVSQHHAKIWRDLDGHISLTDMGSVNGTEVNGRLVQTVELRAGDRIVCGKTVMRLFEEPAETSPTPPAVESPEKRASAIDLGFERETRVGETAGKKTARRPSKLLLFVVIGAVLAVLAAVLLKPLLKPGPPAVREEPMRSAAATSQDLELYFENVEGVTGAPQANVRRHEISLKGRKLTVEFDDVKESIKIRKEKELSAAEWTQLVSGLDLVALSQLKPGYIGRPEASAFSQLDFRATKSPEFFRVVVRDTLPPDVLAAAREHLETFVKNQLGIVFIAKVKRLELARQAYENAERDYAARAVKLSNLFTAVKFYYEALQYLEGLEREELFQRAKDGGIRADKELNDAFNEGFNRALLKEKVSDWAGAERELETILQMIPDRQDKRYDLAYKELVKVRMNLKK